MQPLGFDALEQRRAALTQVADNSVRYGSSFISIETTGWGEVLVADCQSFNTTFVSRPSVSHAVVIEADNLVKGRFPRITAGVRKWQKNKEGHYIGAWLFVCVETLGVQDRQLLSLPQADGVSVGVLTVPQPLPEDPKYKIIHDFTFTGYAMKTIPVHLLER